MKYKGNLLKLNQVDQMNLFEDSQGIAYLVTK